MTRKMQKEEGGGKWKKEQGKEKEDVERAWRRSRGRKKRMVKECGEGAETERGRMIEGETSGKKGKADGGGNSRIRW